MPSAMVQEVLAMIETQAATHPSAIAYELAYQARVAMDRIRFAIRNIENGERISQAHEVGFQLLDALDRLESAERAFQRRFRDGPAISKNGSQPRRDKTEGNV